VSKRKHASKAKVKNIKKRTTYRSKKKRMKTLYPWNMCGIASSNENSRKV